MLKIKKVPKPATSEVIFMIPLYPSALISHDMASFPYSNPKKPGPQVVHQALDQASTNFWVLMNLTLALLSAAFMWQIYMGEL